MKNTIKTFALFLTAGAMLASCDSYLDRQPDEPLTSDNIFKKQKTTLQYLTNIYSYQPDYEAPACVSNSNDIPWEACSDETSFSYLDRSYTQINYKGRPVRVTTLQYGDIIKWLNNRSAGLPAYLIIDMVTQNVEVVRL